MALAKRCSIHALFIVICLTLFFGCESQPEVSLDTIAEQYWTKRWIEKDYKYTYNLESEKDSLSFPEYLKRVEDAGQIKYLSVKTKEAKIDKDKGTVILNVKFKIAAVPKDFDQTFTDLWVYKSNRWLHELPKK